MTDPKTYFELYENIVSHDLSDNKGLWKKDVDSGKENFAKFINSCIEFNTSCSNSKNEDIKKFKIVWVWHSDNIKYLMENFNVDSGQKFEKIKGLNSIYVNKSDNDSTKFKFNILELLKSDSKTAFRKDNKSQNSSDGKLMNGLLIIRHGKSTHNLIDSIFKGNDNKKFPKFTTDGTKKYNLHHLILDSDCIDDEKEKSLKFCHCDKRDNPIELSKETLFFTTKLKRTVDTCEIFRTIMLNNPSVNSFSPVKECIKQILPAEYSSYSKGDGDLDNKPMINTLSSNKLVFQNVEESDKDKIIKQFENLKLIFERNKLKFDTENKYNNSKNVNDFIIGLLNGYINFYKDIKKNNKYINVIKILFDKINTQEIEDKNVKLVFKEILKKDSKSDINHIINIINVYAQGFDLITDKS